MSQIKVGDTIIPLDVDGHLEDFAQWSPEIAGQLAKLGGIDALNERHFKVLNYIREYYEKFGVAPMLHLLTKSCGIGYRELHDLFHKQPGKRAAMIAGLSKATGCV